MGGVCGGKMLGKDLVKAAGPCATCEPYVRARLAKMTEALIQKRSDMLRHFSCVTAAYDVNMIFSPPAAARRPKQN